MMMVKVPLRVLLAMVICFAAASLSNRSLADELRPAYLQLEQTQKQQFDVLWKVPARGKTQRLSLHLVFGEDVNIVAGPYETFINNAHVTRWKIQHPNDLDHSEITIDGLPGTSTEVLMRVEYLDGVVLTHRFKPESNSYTIAAKPTWRTTMVTYFVLGVEHIWFGLDHLLFVLVLLLLVNNLRKLLFTITTFTIAHSITLILAALNLISVPVPPVEACIALSIVFVATEIIRGQQGRPGITERKPWIVAFAFGLLHGLGFAAALEQIGLPQNTIVSALLVFNLGVEVGQLLFIAVVLVVWKAVMLLTPFSTTRTAQWCVRVPAYAIGSLAAFWTLERVANFVV